MVDNKHIDKHIDELYEKMKRRSDKYYNRVKIRCGYCEYIFQINEIEMNSWNSPYCPKCGELILNYEKQNETIKEKLIYLGY